MLRSCLLATMVLGAAWPSAFGQGSRYGDASGTPAAPGVGAQLPISPQTPLSSQDMVRPIDPSQFRATPPRTMVESAPPQQPRQASPQAAAPVQALAPVASSPRPYGAFPPSSSSPPTATSNDYAESLMRDALTAPPTSQLQGVALSLPDVVRAAGTRSEQSESIGAYWDLCSAVADYYLSLHEEAELERLVARTGGPTNSLREAVAKLKTRRDTSLTAARASQLRLAALIGRPPTSPLPLPGDKPLCAVYHTRYSQSFPTGGPQEATELNRLLPMRYAELLNAAVLVGEAEDWFEEVARRADRDQGAGVVKALELLALNRRAFVQIARDYNKRITRYTELARPGELRTERLVAMLIKTNAVASRTSQPVSPGLRTRSQAIPPATFRDPSGPQVNVRPPRQDSEVLPAGAVENHNLVEKIVPGESSVLIRNGGE